MLLDELWIDGLANRASVEVATCQSLWHSLCAQLSVRLGLGTCLVWERLGYWFVATRPECLLVDRVGDSYIAPPRITLRITPDRPADLTSQILSLSQLTEAIGLASGTSVELVQRWLSCIEPQLWQSLEVGRTVSWPELGVFSPVERRGSMGYTFVPSDAFAELLNKPFAMFAPVLAQSEAATQGMERIEIDSIEHWRRIQPLELLLPVTDAVPIPLEQEPQSPQTEHREEQIVVGKEPSEALSRSREELAERVAREADEALDLVILGTQTQDAPVRGNRNMRFARLVVMLLLLGVIVGIVVWWIRSDEPRADYIEPISISEPAIPSPPRDEASTRLESASAHVEEPTLSLEVPAEQEVTSVAPQIEAPSEVEPSTKPSQEAELVTIKPGDSLVRLALRKYGHKAFWVYIYEENREKIKDPDRIDLGTKLTLPAARKYGIDPTDTNSVNRALSLQRAFLSQKQKK